VNGSPAQRPGPAWFDVEPFRAAGRRLVVVRRPPGRALVLGAAQRPAIVDEAAAARTGTAVLQRRSGGGAVLLVPEDSVWVDVWVPVGDPLFEHDVVRAADWVGRWWTSVLEHLGVDGAVPVTGRAHRTPLSDLVCFGALAGGEVQVGGRKVVGVSQWRCRQGALLQCMAYLRWDPGPLLDLLHLTMAERRSALGQLTGAVAGIAELRAPEPAVGLTQVEDALLAHLPGPGWLVDRPGAQDLAAGAPPA
jgi:lipoate-protein ligase A